MSPIAINSETIYVNWEIQLLMVISGFWDINSYMSPTKLTHVPRIPSGPLTVAALASRTPGVFKIARRPKWTGETSCSAASALRKDPDLFSTRAMATRSRQSDVFVCHGTLLRKSLLASVVGPGSLSLLWRAASIFFGPITASIVLRPAILRALETFLRHGLLRNANKASMCLSTGACDSRDHSLHQ